MTNNEAGEKVLEFSRQFEGVKPHLECILKCVAAAVSNPDHSEDLLDWLHRWMVDRYSLPTSQDLIEDLTRSN